MLVAMIVVEPYNHRTLLRFMKSEQTLGFTKILQVPHLYTLPKFNSSPLKNGGRLLSYWVSVTFQGLLLLNFGGGSHIVDASEIRRIEFLQVGSSSPLGFCTSQIGLLVLGASHWKVHSCPTIYLRFVTGWSCGHGAPGFKGKSVFCKF